MSQKRMELGVGCRIMFSMRWGWPRSTNTNRPHMRMAATAMNSPKNDDAAEDLVMMQIIGQNQHHPGGGHSHQKGQLGDVKSPGYVPVHARDLKAMVELIQIGDKSSTQDGA